MNVETKLKKLKHLKKGWFQKDSGVPIDQELLRLLFTKLKSDKNAFLCLRSGSIFPLLDSGISIVWETTFITTTLECHGTKAIYIEKDHTDGLEYRDDLDLKLPNTWKALWDKVDFNTSYSI